MLEALKWISCELVGQNVAQVANQLEAQNSSADYNGKSVQQMEWYSLRAREQRQNMTHIMDFLYISFVAWNVACHH